MVSNEIVDEVLHSLPVSIVGSGVGRLEVNAILSAAIQLGILQFPRVEAVGKTMYGVPPQRCHL